MPHLCSQCRTTIHEGEPHPASVCSLVQATRDLVENVETDQEGRYVAESTFERVRAALEALDTLTPADLASSGLAGLDLTNGPWEVVSEKPGSDGGSADTGSPPRLRIVPGGKPRKRSRGTSL